MKDHTILHFRLMPIILLVLAGMSTADEPAKSRQSSAPVVLTIAGSRNLPPFSMLNEKGEPAGIGVDIWRLWSQKSGIPVRFKLTDIAGSLHDLKEGRADLHAGLFISNERSQLLDYSKPYLRTPAMLYYRSTVGKIRALDDFEQERIAIRGPPPGDILQQLLPKVEFVCFQNIPQMIESVEQGDTAGFIADRPSADLALLTLGLRGDFKMLDSALYQLALRAAVPKGRAQLLQQIEQGMGAISQAEMQEILHRWLGRQVADYGIRFPYQAEVQLSRSEQAWIEQHQRVRIAIDPDYAPYEFRDAQDHHSGMSSDYLELLGRHLGLEFVLVPTAKWNETLKKGYAKEVDLLPLLIQTPERARHLLFTDPYITSSQYIIVRTQSEDIRSESDLVGRSVALPVDYAVIDQLRQSVPEAKVVEVVDIATALRKVSLGEADATILSLGIAGYWLERTEISNLRIADAFGQSSVMGMACRNDWPELASILQKGLNAIGEEERRRIHNRWISFSKKKEKTPQQLLNETELAWLAAHPVIEVGVMNAWPPMDFVDKRGRSIGIGADFIRAINRRLGDVLHPHPGSWEEIYGAVQTKRLPALIGITPHPERRKDFLFTDPYLTIPYVIIARQGTPYARNISELNGRSIAVEKGFVMTRILTEKSPDIRLQEYASTSDALDAVAKGEADAYIGNRAVALYLIEHELISNLQIQGKIGDIASVNAIGVRKDWPILQGILQKALADITVDERHAILSKWVSNREVAPEPKLVLSDDERAWLKAHPQFRLGLDPIWEPIEFIDKQGKYRGISSAFMQRLADLLGVELHYDPKQSWAEAVERAKNGEVDLLPALNASPKRAEFLNFTKPYLHFPFMIITRTDAPLITGMEDLGGWRIAVERDYVTREYLERDYPALQRLLTDNTAEALRAVATGRASAYVGNLAMASYLIDKQGLGNLKVAAPTPYSNDITIGVRKDWPELVTILDKALATISNEERRAIRQQSLAIRYDVEVNYALLWKVVAAAAGLLLLSLMWVAYTRRQKAALAKAKAEAEQANRFKSYFLANMSHEIRTPMNAIMGFSYLALQTEMTSRQYHYMDKIHSSSQALLGVINDILDFSRIEAGRLEVENVSFSLDEVYENLANITMIKAEEKGLELTFHHDPAAPDNLIGDPLRLGQVLTNLVGNAIKFTEQGEVRVSVDKERQEGQQVWLRFSVSDTGIGIPEEQISRLFGAFTQLDDSTTRRYGGSGLGLSICRHLVQLMGGEIEAQSTPGEGSTFSFRLPFALGDAVAHDLTPDPDLRGLRALVVDDNPSAREILAERLTSFTFDAVTARNAAEAFQRLEEADREERPFKLVLMDWRMPGVNGVEAGRRIKHGGELLHVPAVILVTGYGREEVMRQAEAAGLDGFLIKPVSPSTLFDTVIRILGGVREEGGGVVHGVLGVGYLKGHLLLVEDNTVNQQVAREILEGMGLEVEIAGNGREALDAVQGREYDLVLMDIQMPEMDGYEATRRIRAESRLQQLPVIAMTAHAMSGERERCLEAGMNEHVPKPIDPVRLFATLSRWLKPSDKAPERMIDEVDVTLPENLPGIDLRWGLERIGGNKRLFRKLLGDFATNHGHALELVSRRLAEGDLDSARRELHTLKGVAGNIGALILQRETAQLEQALKVGKLQSGADLPISFRDAFTTLFDGLATLPENEEPPAASVIEGAGTADGDLHSLLRELRQMLIEGEPDAVKVLASIEQLLIDEAQQEQLTRIATQIGDYDFDGAKSTLDTLFVTLDR